MQHAVWLAAVLWLAATGSAAAQSQDQQYVRIALLMQEAEVLENNNQYGDALAKFAAARNELNRFSRLNPGWHPRIIEYRGAYLADKIASLAGASPPPMNPDDLPPALRLLNSNRPLVIGHRGYSAFAPENTLRSFELALKAGVDLVELDFRQSKDGMLMVFHDDTLDRTSDALTKWDTGVALESRTSEELRSLDAGGWLGTGHAGLQIPTLSEALELITPAGLAVIERKTGDPGTCLELLKETDLVNRVVVIAFDWDYLREFNRLAPEQVLGALGPPSTWEGRTLPESEQMLNTIWLERLRSTSAKIVVWNDRVTPEAISAAHDRGYKVWIYTVNDPATASRLLDARVDGLITDNPALIWKTIASR